ncbi:MAG: hypothetical protein AAFU73_07335 [Planctomycetota bacterium]
MHLSLPLAGPSLGAAALGLAAFAGAVPARPPVPATQEQARAAVEPPACSDLPAGLHPAVARALGPVHAFERRCIELGIIGPGGALDETPAFGADDARFESLRSFLSGDDEVFPGVSAFRSDGAPTTLQDIVACGRFHAGWRGARALADDPSVNGDVLLRALEADVVTAEPIEGSEDAVRMHRRALEQGAFAPLGNGGVTCVVWGALVDGGFWTEARGGAAARAGVLHRILERGANGDGWARRAALETLVLPLAWNEVQPGRGVAGSSPRARGTLGFTAQDQRLAVELRDGLLAVDATADADALDERRARLEYAAVMLQRILRDRGTVLAADEALRRGSLPERLQFWRDLARRSSFEDFRAAYLDELVAVGVRADGLGDAARIAELRSRADDLSDAEMQELARLERAADVQRRGLVAAMGDLLVDRGGPLHFAAVASTLAGPTEALLAAVVPEANRNNVLGGAWRRLALQSSEQCHWIVEDRLEGTIELPDYGYETMVMSAASHALPGADAVLTRVLEEGSLTERAAAITNPGWLDADRFEAAWRDLDGDFGEARGANTRARVRVAWCLVGALGRRPPAERRPLLLESFERGRWRDTDSPDCWWNLDLGGSRDRMLEVLGPAERASLVERGLAPPALAEDG